MGVLFSGKLKGAQLYDKKIANPAIQQQEQRPSLIRMPQTAWVQVQQPQMDGPWMQNVTKQLQELIQQQPRIQPLIQNQTWMMKPSILNELMAFNILPHIKCSHARTMHLATQQQILNKAIKLLPEVATIQRTPLALQVQKQHKLQRKQVVYSDLFSISYLRLRKLHITGLANQSPLSILSLQVLQYLDAPLLQQLHADHHQLTSIKFLRKCHWKHLTDLTLRNTLIPDSAHFALIMPQITNSKHIQAINLGSRIAGENWVQVSWLLKMGFYDSREEHERLQRDQKYFAGEGNRMLRRVEFRLQDVRNRAKHIQQIRKKFNNKYVDNPLSLW